MLIENGCDVNDVDSEKKSPLMYAVAGVSKKYSLRLNVSQPSYCKELKKRNIRSPIRWPVFVCLKRDLYLVSKGSRSFG